MKINPVGPVTYPLAIGLIKQNNLPADDITAVTHLFVVEEKPGVIGTIGAEIYDDNALLRSLSVNEGKRNRGVGKHLVEFIEGWAKNKGIRQMYLLTTTADGFFQKKGYRTVERTAVPPSIQKSSEFNSVCPSSAVVMKKNL